MKLKLLKQLSEAPGVSGREERVAASIAALLETFPAQPGYGDPED